MDTPNAPMLLRLWEEGVGSHPIRRALALLDAASHEPEAGRWASAPVGARDAGLLALYEALFGADLNTVTDCPRCGDTLESSFLARETGGASPPVPVVPATLRFRSDGFELEYRLPSSEDLLAIIETPEPSLGATQHLLRRCVLSARRGDRATALEDVSEEVVRALGVAMAEQDPGAIVRISLACPTCAHAWDVDFDIVLHILGELDDWAERTLVEVHVLATAYGWGEREILDMSPTRRLSYIEMVQA